ncbi:hypothetical protein FHX82_005626 [Amycolatopsis bartoniae]|uniref:Uncharacterized protein n=1 Tax=Amycolatopsis bartoniae TaxID=941986 RepID=A0A8H9J2Y5_9PSEU|nr:hypothetical protein [Amycolatopsis bartoniae]MBB2938548.1 hypothetical protein [Amycolatopsis bartoniae]TVT10312.1 hypothetical protein FNH07_05300 [Amycolatopsis bartoniae]GHF70225.1 hypothetical protein GCM10017566_49970 [Amycolatopsis bartoniae]
MPASPLDELRDSGPAFAGLTELRVAAEPGHYSAGLQVWVHESRPVALSALSHLKSDTIEGNED